MGCFLSCDEPEEYTVLAEYNPMILGDKVEKSTATMYTEKLVNYTSNYIQPVVNTMIRGVRSTYNPPRIKDAAGDVQMLI